MVRIQEENVENWTIPVWEIVDVDDEPLLFNQNVSVLLPPSPPLSFVPESPSRNPSLMSSSPDKPSSPRWVSSDGVDVGETATHYLDVDQNFSVSPPCLLICSPSPNLSLVLSPPDQPSSPLWNLSDRELEEYYVGGLVHNEDNRLILPPTGDPGRSCTIMERMMRTFQYLKEPVEMTFLTARPLQHRTACRYFKYSVNEDCIPVKELPYCICQVQFDEWTRSGQYYCDEEYPHLNHALRFRLRRIYARPHTKPSGKYFDFIFMVKMTAETIDYAPEVDKRDEVVDLRSHEILDYQIAKEYNESHCKAFVDAVNITNEYVRDAPGSDFKFGKAAISSCSSCFPKDVTQFYENHPLVHNGKKCGSPRCIATCLQSNRWGNYDIRNFYARIRIGDGLEQLLSVTAFMDKMENYNIHIYENCDVIGSELGSVQNHREFYVHFSKSHSSASSFENRDLKKTLGKRQRKVGNSMSLEVLQQHFHLRLVDAAKSLGVSRTTLKRHCRRNRITRWPSRKNDNNPQSIGLDETGQQNSLCSKSTAVLKQVETQVQSREEGNICNHVNEGSISLAHQGFFQKQHGTHTSCPDQAFEQGNAATSSMPHVTTNLNTDSTVTVKASYGGNTIKFRLSTTSGVRVLKDELMKRFALGLDTFDIKYKDNEDELILLVLDPDLQECMNDPKVVESRIVRLQLHDKVANQGAPVRTLIQ